MAVILVRVRQSDALLPVAFILRQLSHPVLIVVTRVEVPCQILKHVATIASRSASGCCDDSLGMCANGDMACVEFLA